MFRAYFTCQFQQLKMPKIKSVIKQNGSVTHVYNRDVIMN